MAPTCPVLLPVDRADARARGLRCLGRTTVSLCPRQVQGGRLFLGPERERVDHLATVALALDLIGLISASAEPKAVGTGDLLTTVALALDLIGRSVRWLSQGG